VHLIVFRGVSHQERVSKGVAIGLQDKSQDLEDVVFVYQCEFRETITIQNVGYV